MAHLFQKLPSLSGLVAFEAAYRHSSFTRAADELALSQASVSRRVRELEDELGVQLFERQRYDVAPTEHGETLAKTARLSLNEIAETAQQLRNVATSASTLTVFSDLGLGMSLVAPVVGEFQRAHPEVELRVLASYEPIEKTSADFDFGLQYGEWAPERFTITALINEVVFPVCSPGLAKQLGSSPSAEDLLKHTLIHLEDVGRKWTDWNQFFAEHKLKNTRPEASVVFNSYQVCLDVAAKGDGIALGWGTTVKDPIDRGALVALPLESTSLQETVNLYQPLHKRTTDAGKTFINLIHTQTEVSGG